jgi:hypothetical protein
MITVQVVSTVHGLGKLSSRRERVRIRHMSSKEGPGSADPCRRSRCALIPPSVVHKDQVLIRSICRRGIRPARRIQPPH